MRNMSFALTTPQLLNGTKWVTRRLGWKLLKPGDRLCAVRKSQGLKKGEKVERLAIIEVINVRREKLCAITKDDVKREGFPDMSEVDFVYMFADHNKSLITIEITRIEFKVAEYL